MEQPPITDIDPAELGAYLEHSDGRPHVVRTTVTVSLAIALLARYTKQSRALNRRRVERLAGDIQSGELIGELLTEVIAIAPDGTVFAGQHLLHAVLQSRTPVPNVLVRVNAQIFEGIQDYLNEPKAT